MATDTLTVLIDDEQSASAIPIDEETAIRATRDPGVAARAERLLVLTAATHLENIAACVRRSREAKHLMGVLVRTDMDAGWLPQVLDRAGLRTLQKTLAHGGGEVPERILKAWSMGAAAEAIATAAVLGDTLAVLSCALERHEIRFDAFPALRRMPVEERTRFVISEYGTYIHWPASDVHLDLDTILMVTDPARRAAAELERIAHDEAFGAAVRAVREERGIRQSDVPGLSERQVRRIERGESAPTVDALEALAAAHGLDADAYLEEVVERMEDSRSAA